MKRPKGSAGAYVLTYEECRQVIDQMRFGNESELFGKENSVGKTIEIVQGSGSDTFRVIGIVKTE